MEILEQTKQFEQNIKCLFIPRKNNKYLEYEKF